jgi:hypothetical protein
MNVIYVCEYSCPGVWRRVNGIQNMELTNWIPILIFPIIKYMGEFWKEIKRIEGEKYCPPSSTFS